MRWRLRRSGVFAGKHHATALAIGCATLIMSTLGMMIGRFIGPMLGKRAEILGGVVLIGIGVQILWTHFHG